MDNSKIKKELGYQDVIPAKEGIKQTVRWLLKNRPQTGGEVEHQLRDPFNYEVEDKIIKEWQKGYNDVRDIPFVIEERLKYGYTNTEKSEKKT